MKNILKYCLIFALFSLITAIGFASFYFSFGDPLTPLIQYEIRLPRFILAATIGMGLSVAGLILQTLFQNPLCEPYTTGIASGAAIGAALGSSVVFSGLEATLGLAWGGSLLFSGLLLIAARFFIQGTSSLLLLGILLNFIGTSFLSIWMTFTRPEKVQPLLFWLLGDLSQASLRGSFFIFSGIFITVGLIATQAKKLDLLLLGEEDAKNCGLNFSSFRTILILMTSLLVTICVVNAGMIGFVGLLVPYFARKLYSPLHRWAIPISALIGATLLTAADFISRALFYPVELPIGAILTLVGAPLLVVLLFIGKNHVLNQYR